MYYIVEIPHQRPVTAWKAEPSEVIAQAHRMTERSGESFFENTTPRELLAQFGYSSIDEARASEDVSVADLIQTLVDRFGFDTAIYKGFGVASDWQTEPVDELACALNYIGHDLSSLHVFRSAEDALRAITEEPEFNCHQGAAAEQALLDLLQPRRA